MFAFLVPIRAFGVFSLLCPTNRPDLHLFLTGQVLREQTSYKNAPSFSEENFVDLLSSFRSVVAEAEDEDDEHFVTDPIAHRLQQDVVSSPAGGLFDLLAVAQPRPSGSKWDVCDRTSHHFSRWWCASGNGQPSLKKFGNSA